MREYTSKVDKLEEAEKLRAEEVKEENNKPIVMGEFPEHKYIVTVTQVKGNISGLRIIVWVSMWLWLSYSQSQPDDT